MTETVTTGSLRAASGRGERLANWSVHLAQLLFVAVVLLDLDGPFVSAHNERQNQSFDMARHVYRDGWKSVITPKVSYVYEGYEKLPYMAALQEVPFNGLIMWPLAPIVGHERALARLVATAFSLVTIHLLYLILRHWLPAGTSAAATIIFALSPLVLHFGQVPMPDIVCAAGMLAAFLFALRGKLPASSASFAFALLAKPSVIVFGLPILVALLVQRGCLSPRECLLNAIAWGWVPLMCLVGWFTILTTFAPPTAVTISGILAERGHWISLVRLNFYRDLLGCIFVFGAGVLGGLGLLAAPLGKGPGVDRRIKWAIILSILVFIVCVYRKVPEPQYVLALLPWVVMGGAFGLDYLIGKWRAGAVWRVAISAAVVLHILIAAVFTLDLKATRVPDYADIERAAQLLPAEARVIVVYRYYGAGPAVWLDRNVVPMGQMTSLPGFGKLHREGFNYVLLLDIESWHDAKSNKGPLALVSRIFNAMRKTPVANSADLLNYTGATSPFRQYCDQRLSTLFVSPRAVLYSIPDALASNGKP